MKQFFAFVRKEFYHILRDNKTLLLLIGMPVVQVLLFGFAINMEVTNVKTAIYDLSGDKTSRLVSEHISHNPYFDIQAYPKNKKEINQMLKRGEIQLAVIFPPYFEKSIIDEKESSVQVIVDASDPNLATIATGYIESIIGQVMSAGGNVRQGSHIDIQNKMLYNPRMKSAYNFVPGIMGFVLIIICCVMTSLSIVREKERGTMEVLLVSPMQHITMLVAKFIPYLVLSLIDLAVIYLISIFLLEVPIRGNIILLTAVSTLYIILSLLIGLFVSTSVKTQVTAIIISGIGMMMPTLVLSGMAFPISNMPEVLQWFSCIVPARWYIAATKKIMIEGQGFTSVIKEVSIIIGMIIALLLASLLNIKNRLE